MKYMGSKRSLLKNGLGEILQDEVPTARRFVDLFCGTGQVSWFVAETMRTPVLATDLQEYAVVLAGAIVQRSKAVSIDRIMSCWLGPAQGSLHGSSSYQVATANQSSIDSDAIGLGRQLCAGTAGGPIWRAYGGHYFSPMQAATFDHLIEFLPQQDEALSRLCRASLILTASRCAASPGHTAQPFQPSVEALPYIRESWQRDPVGLTLSMLERIAPRHAQIVGETLVADANEVARGLDDGDLVFVDPPYSNVQYSRFYHVLETIARGSCGPVSGVGRYPPRSERPRSAYSLRSSSNSAMLNLLESLAYRGCRVVLTFPQGDASNGVNGQELADLTRQWFVVKARVVDSKFSTLGGNGFNRRARHRTEELVLTLLPS